MKHAKLVITTSSPGSYMYDWVYADPGEINYATNNANNMIRHVAKRGLEGWREYASEYPTPNKDIVYFCNEKEADSD